MTRIALDIPVASQRLALRRWLEARGHRICEPGDPDVDLRLTDSTAEGRSGSTPVPIDDAGRIDFGALDSRLKALAPQAPPENSPGEFPPAPLGQGDTLITHSPRMAELQKKIEPLSTVALPVLITGETGAGKEIVARRLHQDGPRNGHPFVALNCAAIPESLFETELFGHERGSFTDAVKQHAGSFEQAGSGTLFLDEVAEIPLPVQAKLLRVLQENTFRRVGGVEDLKFRARLVTASQNHIDEAVDQGGFRADLFHRIAAARLEVPPLRERPEDFADLCRILMGRIDDDGTLQLAPDALELLTAEDWPGNVRQLANVLHRAAVFARSSWIDASVIREHLPQARSTESEKNFDAALRRWVGLRRASGAGRETLREEILQRFEIALKPPKESVSPPDPDKS